MSMIKPALNIEQLLKGMRQLSDREETVRASALLADPKLEAFVEELDDNLECERALNEGPPAPC
jgi:hypothetical protein